MYTKVLALQTLVSRRQSLTGKQYLGAASAGVECNQVQPAHLAGPVNEVQVLVTPKEVGRYWGESIRSALGLS